MQTFLERDVPQMGLNVPAPMLRRFWTLLAHSHGQVWNAADPAASLGVSQPTVRKYLDHLEHLLMVRQLLPWHENIGKRQIKSPKVYVRDSGLLHLLLGVQNEKDLTNHVKRGASWEGYVIEEAIRHFQPDDSYFWATHNQAELDLLLLKNDRKIGIEIKVNEKPSFTASMRIALKDLKLHKLFVVHRGERDSILAKDVEAISLRSLFKRGEQAWR